MTPDEAQDLLEILLDPEFFIIECENCSKPVGNHTPEDVAKCLSDMKKPHLVY